MPVKESTKNALIAALNRLENGNAEFTDGKLTISNLAIEANVGRASVYRCESVLSDFNKLVARPVEVMSTDQSSLEQEVQHPPIQQTSKEKELRQIIKQLANRINLLLELTRAQEAELFKLKARVSDVSAYAEKPPRT
jgi:hypothetical protein